MSVAVCGAVYAEREGGMSVAVCGAVYAEREGGDECGCVWGSVCVA